MKPLTLAEITQVPDEIERFRGMTIEERLALFLELCDLTDAVQAGRPNRSALRAPEPLSPEAEALWSKLMQHGAHA
jgi:hypothetical protein